MTIDDDIKSGLFRRSGDIEGFVDPVTGEHGFRSEALGIEVRGKDEAEAEANLYDAIRKHPDPHGAFHKKFAR